MTDKADPRIFTRASHKLFKAFVPKKFDTLRTMTEVMPIENFDLATEGSNKLLMCPYKIVPISDPFTIG